MDEYLRNLNTFLHPSSHLYSPKERRGLRPDICLVQWKTGLLQKVIVQLRVVLPCPHPAKEETLLRKSVWKQLEMNTLPRGSQSLCIAVFPLLKHDQTCVLPLQFRTGLPDHHRSLHPIHRELLGQSTGCSTTRGGSARVKTKTRQLAGGPS